MLQTPLHTDKYKASSNPAKIRVLIVEKHVAVRRALCQRLKAASHLDVVAAVCEPCAALEYLLPDETAEPGNTVVLLGLQNGSDDELFRTLDIVRKMALSSVTVVALVPYADEVERTLLQQAGAKYYLLKHIDSMRLIQVIESAARQYPLSQ